MQIFTVFLLIINLVWTGLLYLEPTHTTTLNYLYNFSYGLNFILAAVLSFSYLKSHSLHRLTLIFFGLGFTVFSVAQFIWVYYNLIALTEVPYPSPADFFWLMFYPLMATGFLTLLNNLKVKMSLANFIEILVTSGVIFLLLSTFLSLNNSQAGLPFLTQFLNYAYPVSDAILIALSVITLRSQTGHLNSHLLYFIFGFIGLAAGDTIFAYQTTLESYWNGNITDAIYAIAGFLLLLGMINLPKLFSTPSNPIRTPLFATPTP